MAPLISDTLTPSNTYDETESLTNDVEQESPSITEVSEEEEAIPEQQPEEAAPLEEMKPRDESPSPNETSPGDRYMGTSSSSLMEFSSQSSVRQSMLLKRKEMMLQQARR